MTPAAAAKGQRNTVEEALPTARERIKRKKQSEVIEEQTSNEQAQAIQSGIDSTGEDQSMLDDPVTEPGGQSTASSSKAAVSYQRQFQRSRSPL